MKINLIIEDVELTDLPLTVTVGNPVLAKTVMREWELNEFTFPEEDAVTKLRSHINQVKTDHPYI